LLTLWMMIVAGKDEDIDRVIRYAYYSLLICTLLSFILFSLGYIPDVIKTMDNIQYSAFGMRHPNAFGTSVMQLMAYRMYTHRKKVRLLDILLSLFDILFVYSVVHSRAACVVMVLILVFMFMSFCMKKLPKLKSALLWGIVILGVFSNLGSVLFSLMFDINSEGLFAINKLVSYRLSFAHNAYLRYGLKLFGSLTPSSVDTGEAKLFYVDSSYVYMLINNGIPAYIIHTILCFGTIFCLKKNGYDILLIMFVAFAVHGIMERTMCAIDQNIFLLSVSLFVFSAQNHKEKAYMDTNDIVTGNTGEPV